MPESNMHELAQKLLAQSIKDKVDWEDTGRRGSYRVIFPDVALTISRVFLDYDETPDLVLELMNENGIVIGSLETTPEDPMHPVLSQILDNATRFVSDTGITKALEYLTGT